MPKLNHSESQIEIQKPEVKKEQRKQPIHEASNPNSNRSSIIKPDKITMVQSQPQRETINYDEQNNNSDQDLINQNIEVKLES